MSRTARSTASTASPGATTSSRSPSASPASATSTRSSTASASLSSTTSHTSTSPVSLDKLVLLLHFDGVSDAGEATQFVDSSGNANDGTPVGSVTTGPGRFGTAAVFDGTNYVRVASAASLAASTQITISAWVYPTAAITTGYPGIVAKRVNYGQDVNYTMFLWAPLGVVNLYADLPDRANADAGVADVNVWYHFAAVYDAAKGTESLYINGSLAGSIPTSAPSLTATSCDLTIGFLPQGPGSMDPNAFFTGRIDEVAIWTRALNDQEIMALYGATGPL